MGSTLPFEVSETILRETPAALQFGAFKLFPRRRSLIRDGHEVRIGDRAFDLLTVLVTHAGEILSYAELIDAAWPNRVVSDGNLRTQIAGLQKILGQTCSGERHIKCVALRGYVFVADVDFAQSSCDWAVVTPRAQGMDIEGDMTRNSSEWPSLHRD